MIDRRLGIFALGACVALAGCGSKEDANEQNFAAALKAGLAKDDALCVSVAPGMEGWPLEVVIGAGADPIGGVDLAAQMDALARAGLVKPGEVKIRQGRTMFGPTGFSTQVRTLDLTDQGRAVYREGSDLIFGKHAEFCYAKTGLGEIVKWRAAGGEGEKPRAVFVTFTDRIFDVASWAKDPQCERQFPSVATAVESGAKLQVEQELRLTNLGWETVGDPHPVGS